MYFRGIVAKFAETRNQDNNKTMKINLNNESVTLPHEDCTVIELLNTKGISHNGTAVSINDRIVRHALWESTKLSEGDRVVIISAAFGG